MATSSRVCLKPRPTKLQVYCGLVNLKAYRGLVQSTKRQVYWCPPRPGKAHIYRDLVRSTGT